MQGLRHRWWRARLPVDSPLRDWFDTPQPGSSTLLEDVPLLALDFETNGLDPRRDRILSAGWLRIHRGMIGFDGGEMRLSAVQGVGDSALVHGLRDLDLAQGEDEPALLGQLVRVLAGRVLVAHGASIEHGFIDALWRRRDGVPFPGKRICTMTLEARLRERDGGHAASGGLSLGECRSRHGLPAHREHDALADALACAELFMAQVQALGGFRAVHLGAVTA